MEIGEAIKQGILRIINENEKEKFPIGEVNDYLISNGIINERMDFREIFSIAEPILRELGLEWYGVYGPEGIIVCKPKQDVVEELEKRISKDGMAYIPENVYESINYCLTHLFGISLDDVDDVVGRRYEQLIDDRFNRLRGVFGRGREWNGSGSIREDKEIYRDKWDVLAYILYYFYENYPKMMYILLEGLKRGIKLIPENEVVEILDFGTGPGTVLASICDFISNAKEAGIYQSTKLKLFFIEENEDFADVCEAMLKDVNFAEIKRVDTGIINNSHQCFDLITFSNVLSELRMSYEEKKEYLEKFRARLKSDGYMIIIEPAYEGERENLQRLYKDMRGYYRSGCKFPNDWNHSCLCFKYFVERKKLKTPEKTTRKIKEYFEGEKKKNTIKYVYAIFRRKREAETDENNERRGEYFDPFEVRGHIRERINVYGKVVDVGDVMTVRKRDGSVTKKREIIICNGYGGCWLVFWEGRITESDNISEGDMLYVKNAYVAKEYRGLIQVYIDFDTEVRIETL